MSRTDRDGHIAVVRARLMRSRWRRPGNPLRKTPKAPPAVRWSSSITIARPHPIDPAVTRWYHCITRCVRRAFLLGEGEGTAGRKLWIDRRLQDLAAIFSIAVGGCSVRDNHLHVLVRLDPEVAAGWSCPVT
jgi:hypothetical protein